MSAAIPIYSGNDFYVPAFRIIVSGQTVPTTVAHDVTSVTFKDSLDTFDSVDLVLNNWDDAAAGATHFTYAVDDAAQYADLFAFDKDRTVDVWIGYQNVRSVQVFSGTVESIEPHYPAGSAPTLTVRAVDRLKRLKDQQHTKTWTDTSVADMARAIASDHSLQINVTPRDDDEPQPYFFQQNQYDIVFLMQYARRMGYDLWIDPQGKLNLGPASQGATIVYKLGFHRSLIDFAPRLSMNEQVGKVQVSARDQESKGTFTAEAARAEIGLNADLESFVSAEIRDKVKKVSNQPLHANGQAKQLAREMMRNVLEQMLTATVTCPGLPEIRSGRLVEITDVGSRFSGPYLVTSSTHTLDDSGYKTAFTARREKTS